MAILVGLLKENRWKSSYPLVSKVLFTMAERLGSSFMVEKITAADTVATIRQKLWRIHTQSLIRGIVIFGSDVPVPRVWRKGATEDKGIADMIYGNLTNSWKDIDGDGYFDEEEMPINYIQDSWVCRWIPESINYTPNWFGMIFGKKDFNTKLGTWYKKVLKAQQLVLPLKSAVVIVDTSMSDWSVHLESIKENVTEYLGEIRNEWTAPYQATESLGNLETRKYWCESNVGMIYFKGHSNSFGVGDFKGNTAFKVLRSNLGPTLLVVFGCEVGEWDKPLSAFGDYRGFIGNVLNPQCGENATTAILASGTIQGGAGQDNRIGSSLHPMITGMSLFDFMKTSVCFGDAVRKWIQYGINDCGAPMAVTFAAMSIFGDPTLIWN